MPIPTAPVPLSTAASSAIASDRFAKLASKLPKSAKGTLFGIPLALLRDDEFEQKTIFIAAILLVAGLFFPILRVSDYTVFSWSSAPGPGVARGVLGPLLVALVYGGIRYLPPATLRAIPPFVLRWAPCAVAFLATGVSFVAVPLAHALIIGTGASEQYSTFALLAWTYPILVSGLLLRLEEPDNLIARGMIGLGAFGGVIGGLVNVDVLFQFSHAPLVLIVHNLLFFLIVVLMVASVVFVPTAKMLPSLASADEFLPVVTAILIAWLPLSAFLVTTWAMSSAIGGSVANLILLFPHMLIQQIAFFGILLLTAPDALDELKKLTHRMA